MAEIGSAELTIIPSFKGGQRALERQLGATGGSARGGGSFQLAGRSAGSAFAGGLRAVAGPAMAVLGGAAAFNFAEGAISQASDVGESINALSVVYGDAADEIVRMGEAAASERGLSSLDFNNLSVQFSAFTKTIAGEGGDVVGTLDDLTMRATDFASVMNLDVAEAATIFQSSLAGETEPIRRFGIDLSAAAVEAYAYANGITESGEALTEAEKVQARYGLLMEQTNQTAGDFANTSDSLANRQRILTAEWDNMRAQLGEQLLPVMTDVTGWLIDDGLPALQGFVNDLGDPSTDIGSIASSLGSILSTAGDAAGALWEWIGPDVTNAIEVGASNGAAFLEGFTRVLDAGAEGGMDSALEQAATEGASLSAWAESGDSAAQQFVHAFDLVLASFAQGTVWEDWLGGLGILYDRTPTIASSDVWSLPPAEMDPTTRMLAELNSTPRGQREQPAITASTIAGYDINVNIGTVNATDTNDIVRQAEKTARTASLSGSRPINRGMR